MPSNLDFQLSTAKQGSLIVKSQLLRKNWLLIHLFRKNKMRQ